MIVAIKVSVVLLIIVGSMFISRDYWYPFIPANGDLRDFGWSGVCAGQG